MPNIRTYKRKLRLNKEQKQRLCSWIGVCRTVHNMGLEIRKSAYDGKRMFVHKFALIKQLPELRKEFKWIEDVPAQSLQAAVERMDGAFQHFFKHNRGYPKWATKRKYKSILFKDIKVEGHVIRIPKIGRVKMFKEGSIKGTPKTAAVKIEPTGFFIYIVCDNVPKKFNSENQAIGLDMGISHFCVDSEGGYTSNPKPYLKYQAQLRVQLRALARKKKGSRHWKEQARKVARLHHKIANIRRDFLHKTSTRIAKVYSLVFFEDLKISEMVKNKNIAKHIMDCGWGMFRDMIEYKTLAVFVSPKHTSQECWECKHIAKENRKTQSEFKCVKCGHADNADINAAKNIKSRGTALVSQRSSLEQAFGEESHMEICQNLNILNLTTKTNGISTSNS